MNKSELVGEGGPNIVRSYMNMFQHIRWSLYSEVHDEQVSICPGAGPYTWTPLPVDRQTRLKTLPSRNFVGGR